jgi:hypothetical protein
MRFAQCRGSYSVDIASLRRRERSLARGGVTISPSEAQFFAGKGIFVLPFLGLPHCNNQNWVAHENIPIKAMIFNKKLVTSA